MKIKVLSWNIWVDGDIHNVYQYLLNSDADVICLQEVKPDTDGIINKLTKKGYNYVYAPVEHVWDGVVYKHGPAIFTKHTILSTAEYDLHKEDNRKLVQADIQIGSKVMHCYSTHLTHTHQLPSKVQEEQAINLLHNLKNNNVILTGDFNAEPSSAAIQLIEKTLQTSDGVHLPTWSTHIDGCDKCLKESIDTTLDYIFTSHDLKVSNFCVGSSKASDHLPIFTDIEI